MNVEKLKYTICKLSGLKYVGVEIASTKMLQVQMTVNAIKNMNRHLGRACKIQRENVL